jgi:hypothetical protein
MSCVNLLLNQEVNRVDSIGSGSILAAKQLIRLGRVATKAQISRQQVYGERGSMGCQFIS